VLTVGTIASWKSTTIPAASAADAFRLADKVVSTLSQLASFHYYRLPSGRLRGPCVGNSGLRRRHDSNLLLQPRHCLVDVADVRGRIAVQSEVELSLFIADGHVANHRRQRRRRGRRPSGEYDERRRSSKPNSDRQHRLGNVDPEGDVLETGERTMVN